ncbi:hypothetical protein LCGC14_1217110 [marine sediment metagenome]|uniref:Uncharacterized protein n=1 Tax=marine sediment metagenome TaxID=412755 RepID=A0A0F9LZP9_9ZZZZ
MEIPPAEPLPVFDKKAKRSAMRRARRYDRLGFMARADSNMMKFKQQRTDALRAVEDAQFRRDALGE